MLKKLGPQKWVFDELAGLSKVQFRFKDKEKPQSYVCRLASLLQYYPMEEVISGDYAFKEWRPDLVISILDRLIPDNIRLVSVELSMYKSLVSTSRLLESFLSFSLLTKRCGDWQKV